MLPVIISHFLSPTSFNFSLLESIFPMTRKTGIFKDCGSHLKLQERKKRKNQGYRQQCCGACRVGGGGGRRFKGNKW